MPHVDSECMVNNGRKRRDGEKRRRGDRRVCMSGGEITHD
jgi:hypothetical protein